MRPVAELVRGKRHQILSESLSEGCEEESEPAERDARPSLPVGEDDGPVGRSHRNGEASAEVTEVGKRPFELYPAVSVAVGNEMPQLSEVFAVPVRPLLNVQRLRDLVIECPRGLVILNESLEVMTDGLFATHTRQPSAEASDSVQIGVGLLKER